MIHGLIKRLKKFSPLLISRAARHGCTVFLLAAMQIPTAQITTAKAAEPAELKAKITKAKSAITALKTTLGKELKAAMKAGGPEAAIKICNEKAPEITGQISKEEGLEIRRTALRLRNPKNSPDDWERSILNDFKDRHKKGEALGSMAAQKFEDGELRFMKAIPTGGLCLKCHGTSVKPALLEKIQSLYPSDEATGFLAGDLRGAFSVTIAP